MREAVTDFSVSKKEPQGEQDFSKISELIQTAAAHQKLRVHTPEAQTLMYYNQSDLSLVSALTRCALSLCGFFKKPQRHRELGKESVPAEEYLRGICLIW